MTDLLFEHRITFSPAFDDLVNGCDHPTTGNHGRASVQAILVAAGHGVASVLQFSTEWMLPETYESGLNIYGQPVDWRREPKPGPGALYLHSARPLVDGMWESPTCEYLKATCYSDVSYLASDEGTAVLVREGSDAAFGWLDRWARSVLERQVSVTP